MGAMDTRDVTKIINDVPKLNRFPDGMVGKALMQILDSWMYNWAEFVRSEALTWAQRRHALRKALQQFHPEISTAIEVMRAMPVSTTSVADAQNAELELFCTLRQHVFNMTRGDLARQDGISLVDLRLREGENLKTLLRRVARLKDVLTLCYRESARPYGTAFDAQAAQAVVAALRHRQIYSGLVMFDPPPNLAKLQQAADKLG